jgi:hypothetical protein
MPFIRGMLVDENSSSLLDLAYPAMELRRSFLDSVMMWADQC